MCSTPESESEQRLEGYQGIIRKASKRRTYRYNHVKSTCPDCHRPSTPVIQADGQLTIRSYRDHTAAATRSDQPITHRPLNHHSRLFTRDLHLHLPIKSDRRRPPGLTRPTSVPVIQLKHLTTPRHGHPPHRLRTLPGRKIAEGCVCTLSHKVRRIHRVEWPWFDVFLMLGTVSGAAGLHGSSGYLRLAGEILQGTVAASWASCV